MEFFLKSCSLYEVKKAVEYDLIDGVSLISENEHEPCIATDNDKTAIATCVKGPLFLSVSGDNSDEILENTRKRLGFAPNVVIKIKVSLEGLKACKTLNQNDISVCIDEVKSFAQAVLCAKNGADYICLNSKKLSENSPSNEREYQPISECSTLLKHYKFQTTVIVDRLINNVAVDEAVKTGADAIFITYEELINLMK